MKRKLLKPRVFFNASVILAGLHSPSGGSGTLLTFVQQKRIIGLISEIVLDELLRHTEKLGLSKTTVEKHIVSMFYPIVPAPSQKLTHIYTEIVMDQGDTHVLASTKEAHADFLVTLDKKHLLVLENKIRGVTIVSPKGLLEWLIKNNK
jgi:putative PIN family toxin of toxin-antitoxin system